jgi:putative PIN family toxin of toxin-antitoxin system
MHKIVVDTNIWIRALLAGRATLPVLEAWRAGRFQVVISQPLLDELDRVWQRPRLKMRIDPSQARLLLAQLRWKGIWVTPTTVPPRCRDPRDHPVLAAAIDGTATAIVSGDADLRADDGLRAEMAKYGIEIWGIETMLARL